MEKACTPTVTRIGNLAINHQFTNLAILSKGGIGGEGGIRTCDRLSLNNLRNSIRRFR